MKKIVILILVLIAVASFCLARNLGDFHAGETVRISWNAFDRDSNSATRTTDGDYVILRGDNVPCTLGIIDNEDTPDVGINEILIDTSVDTNFLPYFDYDLFIIGAVIGGNRSMNAILATFSLDNEPDSNGTYGLAKIAVDANNAAIDANTAAQRTNTIKSDVNEIKSTQCYKN